MVRLFSKRLQQESSRSLRIGLEGFTGQETHFRTSSERATVFVMEPWMSKDCMSKRLQGREGLSIVNKQIPSSNPSLA